MSQQNTLLLLLIAAVGSKCIFAKPLLENAVDMDIDLEADESQYVAHHVIKQIFLPRGYGGHSPHRNRHERIHDDSSSEEDSDEDDRHHYGHDEYHAGGYGGFTHYTHHGFPYRGQSPPGRAVHKPLAKGKCDCKGPVLTTTTRKPTKRGRVTTTPPTTTKAARSTPTTTQQNSSPPSTTTTTQRPTTPTMGNPIASSTEEPFLDIDLRFGGASNK